MKELYWEKLINNLEKDYETNLISGAGHEDGKFVDGLAKLDTFFQVILGDTKAPFERHQFDCLMDSMPLILPMAFGMEYWEKHKEKFIKQCNLEHDKNAILIIIKRQYGKTELLVRTAVACLISFPNVDNPNEIAEWVVFSHKGDHAKEILKRCYSFLMQKKKEFLGEFITEERKIYTQKRIELNSKLTTADKRMLQLHEGNIDGLAGKRLFGDEIFKWAKDRADKQYPPQLQVKGTCAFFYTTLKERSHWSGRWLARGGMLMKIVNKGEICLECLDKPYDEAILCDHMPKLQAHFVDPKKRAAIIHMMDPKDAITEMFNVMPNAQGQVWTNKYLEKKMKVYERTFFKEYFAFMDPSMTSHDGSYCATSIIGETGDEKDVLCYANSERAPSNTAIVRFIVKDLEHFVTEFPHPNDNYVIFLFVEHNTVNHSHELYTGLCDSGLLKDRVIYVKGIHLNKKSGRFTRGGVRKGPGDSEYYATKLGEKLHHNKIAIHKDFVTRSKLGARGMINELILQCSRIRAIPYGDGKVKISSTTDLNDKKVNDDLYMSFVSAITKTFILKSPTHIAFNRQYRERQTVYKSRPRRHLY